MTMDVIVEFESEEARDDALVEHEPVELWQHGKYPMAVIRGVSSFSTTLLEEKKFFVVDGEDIVVVKLDTVIDVVQAD